MEKWYEQQEVVALQHFKQIHTLSEYGVRFDMKHLILCMIAPLIALYGPRYLNGITVWRQIREIQIS